MKKIIVLIVFFAMPAMAAMPIAEKDFAFFAEAITVAGYNRKNSMCRALGWRSALPIIQVTYSGNKRGRQDQR